MTLFDPPAPPNCKPEDAELFETDITYSMALGICRDCPIQDWCLDWVDPARNYFDGVAGGVAWGDGHPLKTYTKTQEQPHLIDYMARRGLLKKLM